MILGLFIVMGICGVVLWMTRDRPDPGRHPSTGGALLPDPYPQPRHVRLITDTPNEELEL